MTNADPVLSVSGIEPSGLVAVTSETFTQKRDADVLAAKAIKSVTTPEECDLAATALRALRDIRKTVEAVRKTAAAPFLKIQKELIAKEATFILPSVAEENRLSGLINHYQRASLEAQRAMEAAQTREVTQARAEAEKALREAQEARAKLSFEDVEEESDLDDKELDAQLALESLPETTQLAPVKVHGVSGREVLDYEITDIHAFAQAFPELVTIEPKRAQILDRLNKGDCFRSCFPEEQPNEKQIPRPPGMRVFSKIETRVR